MLRGAELARLASVISRFMSTGTPEHGPKIDQQVGSNFNRSEQPRTNRKIQ